MYRLYRLNHSLLCAHCPSAKPFTSAACYIVLSDQGWRLKAKTQTTVFRENHKTIDKWKLQHSVRCTRTSIGPVCMWSVKIGCTPTPKLEIRGMKGPANRPFAFESNLRIEYFQLQRILITKIINYKWSKIDAWNYIFLITILKHIIKLPAYDHSLS